VGTGPSTGIRVGRVTSGVDLRLMAGAAFLLLID
jgi:hypothetical protein